MLGNRKRKRRAGASTQGLAKIARDLRSGAINNYRYGGRRAGGHFTL